RSLHHRRARKPARDRSDSEPWSPAIHHRIVERVGVPARDPHARVPDDAGVETDDLDGRATRTGGAAARFHDDVVPPQIAQVLFSCAPSAPGTPPVARYLSTPRPSARGVGWRALSEIHSGTCEDDSDEDGRPAIAASK